MEEYTTKKVLEITGVEMNTLRGWLNARRIVPDIAAEVGTGKSRLFSHRNLFEVSLARELHRFGVGASRLQDALDFFRGLDDEDKHQEGLAAEIAEIWARGRTPGELFAVMPAILRYMPGEGDEFHLLVSDPGEGFPAPKDRRAWLTIDVAMLVVDLHIKTDHHWPREFRRALNGEVWARMMARGERNRGKQGAANREWAHKILGTSEETLEYRNAEQTAAAEREAERVVFFDRMAEDHPEILVDRRLRAECGLKPRKYDREFWRSIKTPESFKAVPRLMTEELAVKYKREHPDKAKAKAKS